jgi:EAL domain-containing protein (putative c-di-GMP-specific phosphodiesterase class I)
MGVNLSAHQFRGSGLFNMVADIVRDTEVDPELIELELTETAAMQDPEGAADILAQLRQLGVGLAMDDFGTGYSSWTHLKHFPVGRLKIDRSFVSGLPGDRHDAAIVSAIIEMAHLMGMDVTAEGVETKAQAEFLASHECDLLQGFLYSKAKPSGEITKLLHATGRRGTAQQCHRSKGEGEPPPQHDQTPHLQIPAALYRPDADMEWQARLH